MCGRFAGIPPCTNHQFRRREKKTAETCAVSAASAAFNLPFPPAGSGPDRVSASKSEGPAFAILAMYELVQFRQVGALQFLRIPLNPLTFSGTNCQIAHENGLGQTAGVGEVGHRARLVFTLDRCHKLPLLPLIVVALEGIRGSVCSGFLKFL